MPLMTFWTMVGGSPEELARLPVQGVDHAGLARNAGDHPTLLARVQPRVDPAHRGRIRPHRGVDEQALQRSANTPGFVQGWRNRSANVRFRIVHGKTHDHCHTPVKYCKYWRLSLHATFGKEPRHRCGTICLGTRWTRPSSEAGRIFAMGNCSIVPKLTGTSSYHDGPESQPSAEP